jgi:hypothetical protein
MEARADLVGRVGTSLALIANHQRPAGHNARNAGQPEPLPNAAHVHRIFAL